MIYLICYEQSKIFSKTVLVSVWLIRQCKYSECGISNNVLYTVVAKSAKIQGSNGIGSTLVTHQQRRSNPGKTNLLDYSKQNTRELVGAVSTKR